MTTPPAGPAGACPICGKPTDPRRRPFCSVRCADVDLQRWFSGRYAIPAESDQEPGQETGQEPDREAGERDP